jgi:hypothetical protein
MLKVVPIRSMASPSTAASSENRRPLRGHGWTSVEQWTAPVEISLA